MPELAMLSQDNLIGSSETNIYTILGSLSIIFYEFWDELLKIVAIKYRVFVITNKFWFVISYFDKYFSKQ